MSAQVRHNGTNITGAVVSYERTHNICTSVGILTVEIVGNIGRTFDPWDSIDIYENGDFKVRYYISSVNHTNPKGTITLQCQDISKKLVDYFIPDTYTIETPTYTRPWIEQFLDEVGLEYEFTTASQGVLMSNFTQLGLVSAYEQLLTLLQMSGWYMYFDGTEKAIIGSLNIDFADDIGSVGKTDILEIKKISDDRMLRNRALVIGAYDPFRGTQAAADISVHTPWNYDHRDIRTVVISNSNIPDNESAYGMANMIVKEFARITVEKHITVHGFRDFNLGTALRVTSNVWRGRGLVTTFGTSMSKQGFVTNVVLDERCPRLFGFFDFGDYVYVGTYGEGIWRKHIKFDPTWYDFSNGLTNLNITDLHINQGIFGAVAASGEAYYAIDNVPWNQITLSSLWSSSEDQVEVTESGIPASGLDMIPFSGLMARATIVDKLNGFLRFGIDNYSGINTGDYFITESGNLTASGITSSGNRGWVVEYDVLAGDITGTSYPISLSGSYDFFVVDLENDGKNDYVSVGTPGEGGPTVTGDNGNYGHHYTQPFASTKDYSAFSIYPSIESIEDINNMYRGSMEFGAMRVQNANALIAIDDQISGYTFAVAVGKDNIARKNKFERVYDSFQDIWDVTRTLTTSTANGSLTGSTIHGIYPDLGADTYRIFYSKKPLAASIDFYYIDWNALSNTWGSQTLITTVTLQGSSPNVNRFNISTVVQGDIAYCLMYYFREASTVGGYFVAPSYLFVDVVSINLSLSAVIHDPILEFETEEYETSGRYYYFNSSLGTDPDGGAGSILTPFTIFEIFQDGGSVQIIGRAEVYHYYLPDDIKSTKEYLFAGNSSVIQSNEVYSDTQITEDNIRRFSTSITMRSSQLTATTGMFVGNSITAGGNSFAFNGTTFLTYLATGGSSINDFPFHLRPTVIYPMFVNNGNKYIAYDSDTQLFHTCNATSLNVLNAIEPPANYYLEAVTSIGIGSFESSIYAVIYDDIEFRMFMCPYDFSNFDFARRIYPNDDGSEDVPNISNRTINFGNFFLEGATDYLAAQPEAGVYYVDLGTPDWDPTRYLVLRRDGDQFTLIQEEAYPIRVDISNNAPVLTAGSGDTTFVSNYVYDSELVAIEALSSGMPQRVNDYRYTYLEVGSGLGVEATILYITASGIFATDALTYSGGFTEMFAVPSGYGTRIETSNYGIDGQYIFITTSGEVQTFYQQDPAQFIFTEYGTGFPQSRATIIRLDDFV